MKDEFINRKADCIHVQYVNCNDDSRVDESFIKTEVGPEDNCEESNSNSYSGDVFESMEEPGISSNQTVLPQTLLMVGPQQVQSKAEASSPIGSMLHPLSQWKSKTNITSTHRPKRRRPDSSCRQTEYLSNSYSNYEYGDEAQTVSYERIVPSTSGSGGLDQFDIFAADIANDLRNIKNPLKLMKAKASIRRIAEDYAMCELLSSQSQPSKSKSNKCKSKLTVDSIIKNPSSPVLTQQTHSSSNESDG